MQEIVYKYRKVNEQHLTLLTENKLWFPSVRTLRKEDENEYKNYMDYSKLSEPEKIDYIFNLAGDDRELAISKIEECKRDNWILFDEMGKRSGEEYAKKVGVCSFSRRNDIKYQWEEYADNFNGFCIGFDLSILAERINGHFATVTYNHYKHEAPSMTIMDAFKMGATKKKDFVSENEFRICKLHGELAEDEEYQDSGTIIPTSAYKEIILGHKLDDHYRTKILSLLKENFPNIIIKVVESVTNNAIIIKRI